MLTKLQVARKTETSSHPWEDRVKGKRRSKSKRLEDEDKEREEENKRRGRHSIEVRGKRPIALFYGN